MRQSRKPAQHSVIIFCFLIFLAISPFHANAQTPSITSVQWDPVGAGGTQCASGIAFGSTPGTVVLNGSNLTPSLWSDSQACVVVPVDTVPGTASLQISNPAGSSDPFSFNVTADVVTVTNIVPATAGVGTPVTVQGTNFGSAQADSLVQLRGKDFQIVSWSDTQIVATVPSGIPPGGIYQVDVTVHGVTASGGLTILGVPQITAVRWDPVGVSGNQCINGTGFGSASGTVILNGVSLSPSLWSDSQACVVIPANTPAGASALAISNSGGTSDPVSFSVTTSLPAITEVNPASAGTGTPITISGANFGGAQADSLVQLRGQDFIILSWSNTQVAAIVPDGIPSGGVYSVDVTVHGVTVSGGLTILAVPQITSAQWDPVGVGGNQCVNGTGFGSTPGTITLNGTSYAPSLWSDSQACLAIPASTQAGPATLAVVNAAGPSNTIIFAVTASIPAITSVSPNSAGAGIAVTIVGTNFGDTQANSLVQIRGQNFGIISWSDTQIVATVPFGIPVGGIYSLDITVHGVTVSTGFTIAGTPQLASVQWNPIAVGGSQCANGTGFGSTPGTILLNGASLAPSLWSATQACALVPLDTPSGAASLLVANGAGPSNSLSFTVTAAAPVITSLSPAITATGAIVTITGNNFGNTQGSGSVQLRGSVFGILSWTNTQIRATVPNGIPPGGVYSVDITANGVTVSAGLTIVPAPQIISLNPASGIVGGLVTISGSGFGNFQGVVSFSGVAAAIVSWTDNSIVAIVPAGAFTGNIAVTTRNGLAGNPVRFTVISDLSNLDADIQARISAINTTRISSNIQTLANFGTRNTCSSNNSTPPGIGAARDFVVSQFSAIPGMHVAQFSFTTTTCGTSRTLQDVVAWLPGSGHPDRLIVLGGHYDSRTVNVNDGVSPAPGANDSGSQSAAVIEAARVLAGGSYDATLVFIAWAGEEQGLLGSAAFVQNFKTLFPKGVLELNLNCDIVGGDNTVNDAAALQQFRLFSPGTPREISTNAIGSADNTSPSRLVMHYVGDWGSRYVPEMTMLPNLREDRPGRGSDHESFIAAAIPAVRFIDPVENLAHQHTGNDLFTFVTPDYTARIIRLIVSTAASLARASTPPQTFTAKRIDANTVSVTWAAPSAGPLVDHYIIAARPVTEHFYHTRIIVSGSQTSSQVSNSDLGIPPGAAFFISVAAVDSAGHESIFAYPEFRCTTASCVIPAGALNVTATR
jgi:hypothetical protein